MKYYQLAASAVPYVLSAKMLVIAAAYIYIYLLKLGPHYGPPALYWFTFVALMGLNVYLLVTCTGEPAKRERFLYFVLALDLAAVIYLFAWNPDALLAMLIVLALIVGFYSLVLPTTGGLIAGVFSALVYVFAWMRGVVIGPQIGQEPVVLAASLLLGIAVMGSVMLVLRRVKQGIDELYTASSELARDLSTHAVEAAISVDTLVQRNREIQTLLQIVENFVAVLDFDELFGNIIDAFRNRFQFDKFAIYLYNSDTEHLDLRLESGGELGTGIAKSVRADYGVVGWCFSNGEGVVIQDVTADPRFAEFNPRTRKLRSLACQPLIFRGERLGVLCLDSERANSFDEGTFAFLESVAPLISVAVSNSLHYSIAKEESLTDNLTKLLNHRGFMEKFTELLDMAYCNEIPLSVFLIDIDHFKKVNDTYGHLVGNVILGELAEILKGFFRASDLVARYGGEEFIVVLRGTPPAIAPRIAEQLRRKVEAHQFPISLHRDAFRQVTISLGVASTMDQNLEPEIIHGSRGGSEVDVFLRNRDGIADRIIENTDEAMYAAKREGRNQVMLSYHYPVDQHEEASTMP